MGLVGAVKRGLGLVAADPSQLLRLATNPVAETPRVVADTALQPLSGMATGAVNEAVRFGKAALSRDPNDRSDVTDPDTLPTYRSQEPIGQAVNDVMGAATKPISDALNWSADTSNVNPKVRAMGHGLKALLNAVSLYQTIGSARGTQNPPEPGPTLDEMRDTNAAQWSAARNAAPDELLPIGKSAENAYGPLVKSIEENLRDKGYRESLHPVTKDVLDALYEEGTRPEDFSNATGVMSMRRVLSNARSAAWRAMKSPSPPKGVDAGTDYSMVTDALRKYDDMIEQNMPKTGAAAAEARSGFSAIKRAETLNELIDDAKLQSNGQNQAGFENTLRQKFLGLAKNRREMASFSPEEQAAIRQVAGGREGVSGDVQTTLRNAGRGAVRGPVGGIAAAIMAHGGGPLGLAYVLFTEAARKAASDMRFGDALDAVDLVARRGQEAAPVTYRFAPQSEPLAISAPGARQPIADEQNALGLVGRVSRAVR
jgi:hypothetical protein